MARRKKKGVSVSRHSRSPRGANRGKSRPRVKAHTRSAPNPASYPRYPRKGTR